MAKTHPLSLTDLHLLLALTERELYGYALLKAVEAQSRGAIKPDIGSLYRVIARLERESMIAGTAPSRNDQEASPGKDRRYYRLTAIGKRALDEGLASQRRLLELAQARLGETGS